jgi:hypothetical protein
MGNILLHDLVNLMDTREEERGSAYFLMYN